MVHLKTGQDRLGNRIRCRRLSWLRTLDLKLKENLYRNAVLLLDYCPVSNLNQLMLTRLKPCKPFWSGCPFEKGSSMFWESSDRILRG
jgi:hypothetical protein